MSDGHGNNQPTPLFQPRFDASKVEKGTRAPISDGVIKNNGCLGVETKVSPDASSNLGSGRGINAVVCSDWMKYSEFVLEIPGFVSKK